MPKPATETLTADEANRARALVLQRGMAEAARVLGVDPRTICKALALLPIHALTLTTVRMRIERSGSTI